MTSLDVDVLSVRKIYAKGNNGILPANTILTTDGLGGTIWTSISSINAGLSFNTFITSASTFTSSPGNNQFSILDNSNIGLIPNSGISATLYSKSFGQVDVPGQNSIYSFNTLTGQFNNKINLIGSGTVTISTNSTTNQIYLYSPNDATSSLSSLIKNMTIVNSTMTNKIASFNSPFSTFIYSAISSFSSAIGPVIRLSQLNTALSSFSTVLGPTVQPTELTNAISSFSTAIGPTITSLTFTSTLSSATTASFSTRTLNTSSIYLQGNRQPFIQYGSSILASGIGNVILPNRYVNSNYIIQLTYFNNSEVLITPLSFSGATTSNFSVNGDSNATVFHWTTYGNLF